MVIAPATHTALLALLRQAMVREAGPPAPSAGSSPLGEGPAETPSIDPAVLLAAIQRHRLEICLDSHRQTLALPEQLAEPLHQRALSQRLEAMPIVAAAVETIGLLAERGIRALLFKGPALAVQTTGDLTSRGGGDLDLLVDPQALDPAIEALVCAGFLPVPGYAPLRRDSRRWRYARWAMKELPLVRGPVVLDLHWSLTNVRRSDPCFEAIWRDHATVSLGGHDLPTLSLPHALDHSCAHALDDRWMSLRSLVDIHRLTRLCPPAARDDLCRSEAVQLSCAVAAEATGSSHLLLPPTVPQGRLDRALSLARLSQRESPLLHQMGPWQLRRAVMLWRQRVELAATPADWLRSAAAYALPPAVFNDPSTGKDRPLPAAVASRFLRARQRLRGG
jgi:hypothetical protein